MHKCWGGAGSGVETILIDWLGKVYQHSISYTSFSSNWSNVIRIVAIFLWFLMESYTVMCCVLKPLRTDLLQTGMSMTLNQDSGWSCVHGCMCTLVYMCGCMMREWWFLYTVNIPINAPALINTPPTCFGLVIMHRIISFKAPPPPLQHLGN